METLLVCPLDGGALTHAADDRLRCADGHDWPVRGGVPRMVPDQDDPGETPQDETFESFSSKWTRVSSEEIAQRYRQQHQWYVERYGFGDEAGLAGFLEGKRRVMEAGTGTGGDAARFARLCDADVVGIDLSAAIDVAQNEFGAPDNLHFVQADILRPPFSPGLFDFISSDQVIHHTPDARRAFSTLAERLAPGGHLAVYVYKVKAPLRELADDWIRERATKMSPEDCLELSRDITELGRELSRTGGRIMLDRGVPLLDIPPGEHDVQRLIYWTFMKCFWNDDFSENLNALVNFDWYHPPFASRHTESEVLGWCSESGLDVEHLDVADSGISVLARRPA
jgi:SAM-dependent methyltransferase